MSTTHTALKTTLLISLLLIMSTGLALAQGQGGSGGSSSGNGYGDQTQDRDRVQDPETHDGDEPLQDRDRDQLQDGSGENCINAEDCDGVPDRDRDQIQDRDRLQDSVLYIGDTPVQDRDQLRDRLRDQLEDPDQDRDRIRAQSSAGLEAVITVTEEVGNAVADGFEADIRELARNHNRVDVGVMALIAAQNMVGQDGAQIASIAQEIHATHRTMAQTEAQIQSRSFMRRLFFGGDSERAATIQNQLQRNEERMQQVRQYLNDCDCDEQVRNLLQEQIQQMEEEHIRLRTLAENEASAWGLLSWRF